MPILATLLAFCVLLASSRGVAAPERFQPEDPARGPSPWTSTGFDDSPADFSFAVISDLQSGDRPGVFEVAAAELGLLRPAFVLTIGDMIEGGSEDEVLLQKEWDAFDARLKPIHAPFFHIAGNHDLASPTQREVWARRYGPRYSAFVYKKVLFLALDTEDYPLAKMKEIYAARAAYLEAAKTDPKAAAQMTYMHLPERVYGEISPAQSAYFERAIAAHREVRWTFVLMHKPAYQRSDALGLGRIERALKGRGFTVLNGHLHRYAYTNAGDHDRIMLGVTGGERAFDGSEGALDHFMWVRMTKDGPSIANLRLDGVLDKTGRLPAGGEALCLSHGGPRCPPSP
jgi:hypothetical protein